MYAGFLKRLAAFIMDVMLIWVIEFGVMWGFSAAGATSQSDWIVLCLFLCALLVFYFVYMESSPWQATLGKRIMGIKVVDTHGYRISFIRSLGRYVAFGVSSMACYVGYLMCLWTKKEQCLHDMIAGCLVVTDDLEPSSDFPPTKPPVVMWVVLFGLPLFCGLFTLGIYFSARSGVKEFRESLEFSTVAAGLKDILNEQFLLETGRKSGVTTWGEFPFDKRPQDAAATSGSYCTDGPQPSQTVHGFEECGGYPGFLITLRPGGAVVYRVNSPYQYKVMFSNNNRAQVICEGANKAGKAFCKKNY